MELVARLRSLATENRRRGLAVAVSILLVVLIGFELARLGWLVVEGPVVAASPVAAVGNAPAAARTRQTFTPDMASGWTLFGNAAAQAQAGNASGAPETSLSLQLLGVFSTPDARLAGAVIAERGKDGELFRIGAAVPGGATLESVEKDHVLLRRRGQLETLRFDAAPDQGAGVPPTTEVAAGVDPLGGYRSLKDRLSASRDTEAGGDPQARARQVIAGLSEQLRDNPDSVLNELGLKPLAAAPGMAAGYQVADGVSSEVLRNLGLRPGDVVVSVNGKPLGNVQNDRLMVDEVKASGEARVEIRRGTQTFTVNYPL